MTITWPMAPASFGFRWSTRDAHEEAQDRAGEHRGGHHHALLGVCEAQILGDLHAERAEQHPDHEREIEIEKCRVQRRPMTDLPE
jgi:hypothetical protein